MNEFSYQNCQYCDEPLQGRYKKKFCTNVCRSRYHNKITDDITGLTHKILWDNRTILKYLIDKGETELLETELVQLGFKTNYITNFEDQGEDKEVSHLYVYDIKFYSPDGKTIKIIV